MNSAGVMSVGIIGVGIMGVGIMGVGIMGVGVMGCNHLKQHRDNLQNIYIDVVTNRNWLRYYDLCWKIMCGYSNPERSKARPVIESKQLITKDGKISSLWGVLFIVDTFSVPIINLSSYKDINVNELRYGLKHCYVNKNKYIKRDLYVELENLASTSTYP